MGIATVSPARLHDVAQTGQAVELIDVRTPAEFEEAHVSFARNVPLDRLEEGVLAFQGRGASQPLYVICRSGGRARQACERLLRAGHAQVVSVDGGTEAWVAAGLPVVRGRATMSLERQVRIAAGLLVLLGVLLGCFVHPYWIGLSAFVGAGLAWAGLTDTCGMGLVLAKMPWNQSKACGAAQGDCLRSEP